MQFVRTIVESNRLENIVDIPEEFKNQKVELLILPLLEKQRKKKEKFIPDDFEGILNIDVGNLEKEIKRMREEWERL